MNLFGGKLNRLISPAYILGKEIIYSSFIFDFTLLQYINSFKTNGVRNIGTANSFSFYYQKPTIRLGSDKSCV